MDLLCPHCLKRVAVPDDRAGQALNCPLCGGAFVAPSLAPAVVPPAPPAPPPAAPDTFRVGPPPSTPPPPPPPGPPTRSEPPLPPPPVPGDYTHAIAFVLRVDVLVWLPPICLGVIFLLSFFEWHRFGNLPSLSLWGLAFSEGGTLGFLAYLLFTLFLAVPLSAASLVLEHRWVPLPPAAADVLPWKSLAVAAVLAVTFFLLCLDYFRGNLNEWGNPITPAEKVAFRLHLLALLAAVGEFWLYFRRRWNLPLPKVEFRW